MGSREVNDFPLQKKEEYVSFGEIFRRLCPDYLAMGMSLDEYWRGSPELVVYYREANRLKRQDANYNAWLQGLYIYHANCAASPLYRDLLKDHTPERYLAEPIDIFPKTEAEKEKKEIAQDLENEAKILSWVDRVNRKFAEKEDVPNAR